MRWQVGGGGPVNAARKHVIYQCMRRDAAKARPGILPVRASKLLYSGGNGRLDQTRRPTTRESLAGATRFRRCVALRISWSEISEMERQPSYSNWSEFSAIRGKKVSLVQRNVLLSEDQMKIR